MGTKILITGDFCPINRVSNSIKENNYDKIFNNFLQYSKNVDLAITNLECPLTDAITKIEKTGPCIKAPKSSIKALKYAGFNLVTLANNHIMDFGANGLKSTLKVCKDATIDTVGAAENITEAKKPFITKIKGKRIGILNFAENEFCITNGDNYGANPLNPVLNFYDIQEVKKKVDYLFVIVHGGREHYQLPTPRIRDNFRFFVDAGADVVVSHHTHCYSGYEYYKGKPIFYGLGNFIFDYKEKYRKGNWTKGYAVLFELLNKELKFKIIPYMQGRKEDFSLRLLDENQYNDFEVNLNRLNEIIKKDALFFKSWSTYIESQKESYKSMLFIQNKYLRKLMSMNLLPKFYFQSKAHKTLLLNLFRCETHHEIMVKILDKN